MKGSYRKTFQTRIPAVKVRAKAFGFCRSHFHLRGQYSPRDSVRCAPVPLVPAPFGIAPRAPYATPRSRCRVRVRRPGRIPATLEFGMHLLNWNVWSFVFRWRLYFGPRGPPLVFRTKFVRPKRPTTGKLKTAFFRFGAQSFHNNGGVYVPSCRKLG